MKRRWEFNPSGYEAKIIKPTSGSMGDRAEQWCSTSDWVGNEKVRSGFWVTSRASYRVTAMRPTTMWVAKIVHAACWAHARRKFFQVVELNPKEQTAMEIVAEMDQLFEIDAQARQGASTPEVRLALRLEKSKPLVDEIKSQIEAARAAALPKSLLAKACNYTLTLWPRLSRFLEYPELELSNNWAENAIRPVALGRKNWIHIGSEEAGPRVAAIVSIVETCRRLKLPVRDYLGSVLPGLATFPVRRIADLTPGAWAVRN